ncbi:MAG: acyl dehydratase [Acidobacteriia bacterium]|nr:acyl dehydratase [Terriglobia bacterium]
MEPRYFEDWKPGDVIETIGRTVGDTDITQFVTLCGLFEELFVSQQYVEKHSIYPKRFAPGALTFSFAEGLIVLTGCIHGVGLALLSVDGLTIKRPLFAGDTMKVRVEVLETRPTRRPDRGIVTFAHTVLNQDGESIMECTVQRMLRRRNPANE